jgi:hypothetical protein
MSYPSLALDHQGKAQTVTETDRRAAWISNQSASLNARHRRPQTSYRFVIGNRPTGSLDFKSVGLFERETP